MAHTNTTAEIPQEERFAFGENWANYLRKLTPERIEEAQRSLTDKLGDLAGKTFLDVGCGSGLFSLAARNLGARVTSFDFDSNSVGCTEYLKQRYHPQDEDWTVMQGSALDEAFMNGLGRFDIVYSWGVLHHTGDMWTGIDHTAARVARGGRLQLALYNDQGGYSRRWLQIKKLYLRLPAFLRPAYCAAVIGVREIKPVLGQLLRLKSPVAYFRSKRQDRAMSYWTNVVDWIGGYPFEVSTPEEVFEFCKKRGFRLDFLKTNRGEAGCNEFIFIKEDAS